MVCHGLPTLQTQNLTPYMISVSLPASLRLTLPWSNFSSHFASHKIPYQLQQRKKEKRKKKTDLNVWRIEQMKPSKLFLHFLTFPSVMKPFRSSMSSNPSKPQNLTLTTESPPSNPSSATSISKTAPSSKPLPSQVQSQPPIMISPSRWSTSTSTISCSRGSELKPSQTSSTPPS